MSPIDALGLPNDETNELAKPLKSATTTGLAVLDQGSSAREKNLR